VPFDVRAALVSYTAVSIGDVVIFADGLDRNVVGTNQDPCVFGEVGPLHTFCRIDGARPSFNRVKGTGRLLAESVGPGDLIIYGKHEPKGITGAISRVWIDLVTVVSERRRWMTMPRTGVCLNKNRSQHRRRRLVDPKKFAAEITGAAAGATTRAYQYNLSDAESAGSHCCTSLQDYWTIIGRSEQSSLALKSLSTSFAPLATSMQDAAMPAFIEARHAGPALWKGMVRFLDTDVRGRGSAWIAEFPDARVAEDLCRAIIDVSGRTQGHPSTVAVLPVMPLKAKSWATPT